MHKETMNIRINKLNCMVVFFMHNQTFSHKCTYIAGYHLKHNNHHIQKQMMFTKSLEERKKEEDLNQKL